MDGKDLNIVVHRDGMWWYDKELESVTKIFENHWTENFGDGENYTEEI